MADGKIAEHWDALTPLVRETASGRSQTDGQAAPADVDTSASRALVREFAQRVLQDADYSVLTDYLSTATYLQHNPEAADGLAGFGAAAAEWAGQGRDLVYKTVHKVVAEGDFVLLQSEGEFGEPVAYWDLFRVADGKIVEHWDVITPVSAALPHDNGLFWPRSPHGRRCPSRGVARRRHPPDGRCHRQRRCRGCHSTPRHPRTGVMLPAIWGHSSGYACEKVSVPLSTATVVCAYGEPH